MNIWKILSSRERIETLEFILEREAVGVEEVATSLRRSKGFVSQFLRLLEEEGILRKQKRKYAVLHEAPEVRAIKIMLNITKLQTSLVKHREEWIVSLGVYGSFSKGENREDSDIDIWIRVDSHPGEKEVARIERELSNELGKRVHILILTPERIARLRENDPIFYCELANSFVMWGEGVGF
ncbi:putative nucleotidyltransferase [Archaeoglobus sulfaticallidus PM70-1]|uniref:protein adenylyltransferase n=1 Tax=Archaeoglobus sulfaticallidus PM70-1 TaxID=387631 RepID=N0BCI5_9EURY|nr:nucleotidyltransferase domain-containing protein [Archaeoglobus sulfaticallidus]AGK61324.1 putative nucleotidyltransferase [Archaeoglobus sulfaticallidus PM70-1]